MKIKAKPAGTPAAMDDHARMHTAHIMSDYLLSLSTMCRHYGWHKTGMHVFAAGDELRTMLERDELTQKRYSA